MKVRIGVGLGTRTTLHGPEFGDVVDPLERHGFDSLWLSERIGSDAPDPIVAMAYGAGRTTRLKFGMSVLVLPGRNPVVLAKELATLAVMSGGRLLPAFGLGVADAAEHQAFGVERGRAGALVRRGAGRDPGVLVRRGRRPRRRAIPLRRAAGPAAARPARRLAGRDRPVRAAPGRPARRRVAAVVRHPRRRRRRAGRDRAGRRRARPGDRGRPLRRAHPLHARRRCPTAARPARPAPPRPRRPVVARRRSAGTPWSTTSSASSTSARPSSSSSRSSSRATPPPGTPTSPTPPRRSSPSRL